MLILSQEDHSKIKQLEKDLKEAQAKVKPAGPSAEEVLKTFVSGVSTLCQPLKDNLRIFKSLFLCFFLTESCSKETRKAT